MEKAENPELYISLNYLFVAILIFCTEVIIATCVHNKFVRPYIGDLLVVFLIYCATKTFLRLPVLPVTISVLIFSFAVETLQSIHIVERLEMEDISIVKTVIGTSFSLLDMVMCVTGIMVVLVVEKFWLKKDLIANPAVTGLRQQ